MDFAAWGSVCFQGLRYKMVSGAGLWGNPFQGSNLHGVESSRSNILLNMGPVGSVGRLCTAETKDMDNQNPPAPRPGRGKNAINHPMFMLRLLAFAAVAGVLAVEFVEGPACCGVIEIEFEDRGLPRLTKIDFKL